VNIQEKCCEQFQTSTPHDGTNMIATTTSTTSRSKQFRVEVYSQDHGIVSQPAQDCRTGPRCSLARCDLLLHHLADLVDTSQLRGSIDDAASQRLVYSCSDPSTNFGTSIEHTVQPCGRHTGQVDGELSHSVSSLLLRLLSACCLLFRIAHRYGGTRRRRMFVPQIAGRRVDS